MKLLYAFPEPFPLPRARGVQVANTLVALTGAGVALTFAYVPDAGDADPFGHYGLRCPANVRLHPLSRSLPWPLGAVHSNRIFAWRLARLIERERFDAVFVRHIKLARLLLARRPGLPLVYEAHEVFADTAPQKKRAAVEATERAALRGARLVVANSAATAQRLQARYGHLAAVQVVPNGVHWPAQLPQKNWDEARRRIVYAGSFFGWKGIEDLVAAARLLPGHRITLIGGVAPAPEAGGAELDSLGRIPHAQVMDHLAVACVAVLPNRADAESAFTSPIKLFEYMAAGCAVVATRLPAFAEILGEEDAEWVPAGDPAALAAGIRRLCADPARARAMGARLRERAKGYTWRARGERLRELIAAHVAAVA